MNADHELEYTNITVWFDLFTLRELMNEIAHAGMDIAWKETDTQFRLLVQTEHGSHSLILHKHDDSYRLSGLDPSVQDIRLARILHQFIERARGHAVVKFVSSKQVIVKNIRYGEAVRIVEIKGAEKKVIYEKACSVTMDQVIAALKRRDAEERIPVLRLELDYELATLYDALKAQDGKQIARSKERLKRLRREMLLLEA